MRRLRARGIDERLHAAEVAVPSLRALRLPLPLRLVMRLVLHLPPLALIALVGINSVLVLVGCAEPDDARAIVLAVSQAPANLDPRLATDATSERVNRLLYARLVELDETGRPIPGIARWEQLSPLQYRFELKPDLPRFSDGQRVTSADVAATYRSILDPALASPHRAPLALIERIEELDQRRLLFHLSEPDPLFPAYLGLGILPAEQVAAGHPFQRRPIGSGVLRLIAWPTADRLELERRRDGQRLRLVRVKDPNVRVMKLLRGEVDLLQNDLPPELVGLLRERPGIQVLTAAGINFSYLGFNLADPVTGDPRVRRAIAHAIDREAILRWLFRDQGRLAEALLPPEHWAGAAGLSAYDYDPAQAKRLLAEAGYAKDLPLALSYKTSSDPFRLRLASLLQAQLAAVGIDLEIQSYDWGTFFGDIKAGRFQLFGLTWVGIRLPDIFRYVFHSDSTPPGGANRGYYLSPEADQLIDTARREPDLERQASLYRELQSLLHRDLPYMPLWYEDQIAVLRDGLIGYRLAPDGNYDGLAEVKRAGIERAEPR
ncbi:MAG: ABC transporter substrate-binding protein [Lamprobacter sp.]|uniref:ABC transporter substrate-binding protein n=1 Tax=Lamprobacter sp. TaxID=3100796 RepID=UPI002B25BBA6|nr:ABC transporter substrate-binding protein [Lamprobacter sp.]MEA3638688.1 ABC transporter substrate-binding protein [Lamprobacter sp.]